MNKHKISIVLAFLLIRLTNAHFIGLVQAETLENKASTEKILQQQHSETSESTTREDVNVSLTESQPVESNWTIVSTVNDLQLALKNNKRFIKLADSTGTFDFGNQAIPITSDVTIDGNNRQVSYNGGNLNRNRGLYTLISGLNITLQNMTFGSADFTIPAVGLYGIMQSEMNTQLHIENVNYYSNQSSQPFYLRNVNSKIYFHGTNQFIQQNPDGSMCNGQEFAECNNYEFVAGSHTTIVQNTNDASGGLWMHSNPSSITVGEGAEVDITSNHNFIYSDGANNGVITLDKNSKFIVKGTNKSKGDFYYFDKPAFLTVGEGSLFSVNYANSIKLANGSAFKFLPGSIGNFEISENESVFDRSVGANSTFEIDNAKQLRFQGKTGTSYNPTGFVGGINKFFFNGNTVNYQIVANETLLTPQRDPGVWNIGIADISRSTQLNTPNFTTSEKMILKNANVITLTRVNPPVELLKVNQLIYSNDATFQLLEYQLNNNDEIVKGGDFKLYSQKTTDPTNADTGFIEQHQATNITESVTFSKLKDQTKYWLYVRIFCNPDSQSSEWLEVSFTTKQELINVSFPVKAAFHTKKENHQQNVITNDVYSIDNHSSFAVTIQATDFQELSNPSNVHLLSEEDDKNQKDLFLKLTENGKSLGVLTKNLHDYPLFFTDLPGNSSTTMGFLGKYYGDVKNAQQVQYRLTLTTARKE